MSRRDFIKLLVGGAITVIGAGVAWHLLERSRKSTEVEVLEREVRKNVFIEEGKSLVSVVKGKNVKKAVKKAIELLGGLDKLIKSDDVVLLKPNVGFSNIDAVTTPEVLAAVIEVVKEVGPKKIIIAESAVRGRDTTFNFKVTGIAKVAEKYNVELIDLKKSKNLVKAKTRGGKILDKISTYKEVYDADVIISIPKLKRHIEAITTVSLKNMMGILPDSEKGLFHNLGLHQCIADLNTVFKPDLCIVDATQVMTVSGPGRGKMVRADTILASGDPVAVDLIASKILFEIEGLDKPLERALKIPHLKRAAELGVGVIEVNKIKLIEREIN